MASSPQGIYAGLKTEMKNAYYTETMVDNLENFRTEASAYLSGPGEYEDLTFLKICKNLEGHGHIGYNNLEILKKLVKSTTGGKEQLLHMINNAEKEIQESLSGSACCLPQEMGAQKPKLKDEAIVVSMKKKEYRVKEGNVAFLDCTVDPQPKRIIWKKGDKNRVDIRIPLNSQEYHCTGPPNPTLVIRSAKKEDTAYYQCTAKDIDTANNIEIEVKGVIVPLIVASGASGSDGYRNDRSRSRSRDRHRESRSRSPEDMYEGEQTTRGTDKLIYRIISFLFVT
ncbi:uncharacterized protein LOC110458142 [Mizuhopecten yessoensis]|uniref:Ig-like domain-containing protein n=1 Tax=Mizuhopecten yessoensis TaxID=6573 RepID=A0A210Q799_MIZYE|nr:uncharacterized protein LOC110458142 [Mizuhopecten yessoensis]OWF44610.1 hypothetical protein KP79_PYT24711 [Mizuhopecten yessoensis]